ncbi:hypothetical protein HZR84_13110 [Hyphobacterium sp. CCMP332]|nr:hypothetical protein HZR84_13110 [Hyphobacterium sp. CCMP332]
MDVITDTVYENFERSFDEFKNATDLTKQEKAAKLASQIDILSLSRNGLTFLYKKSLELEKEGFFNGTAWSDPEKLVPFLVKGTLLNGHPGSSFEVLSELRMLYYLNEELPESEQRFSKETAQDYMEEVIVHNLEFAFKEISEETRSLMSEREIKKAINLFGFLLSEIEIKGIFEKLALEVKLTCEQRPIVTRKARELIRMLDRHFEADTEQNNNHFIKTYINALYAPSKGARENKSPDDYQNFVENCSRNTLYSEAEEMGEYMNATGLVSKYHAMLLKKLVSDTPELVPVLLDLNDQGKAEWEEYRLMLSQLIMDIIHPENCQFIYGLSEMMRRNLFVRRVVRVGLENLRKIKINPQVEKRILKSIVNPSPGLSAIQYLMSGVIRVLGQPLGVGQGNNPTCQSARGISMWSQHAPAKLIDMIITVATQNNLLIRFENHDLVSNQLGKGLLEKLDYNLDVVSVVLVPHLDKIYNEMMRRSSGRTEDPHKWVNPSMYGHWIQVGFASCYDYLSNSIMDFSGFVRIFYAAFHPDYNGNRHLVYPNPVGIFITSNKGDMVGFHAISMLRVEKDKDDQTRVYFLNPNNEGRQNWGQEIKPSVYGHGEKHGESSLPIQEFAARVYAFHYDPLITNSWISNVPEEEIIKVKTLAEQSWGKSYIWSQQIKLW